MDGINNIPASGQSQLVLVSADALRQRNRSTGSTVDPQLDHVLSTEQRHDLSDLTPQENQRLEYYFSKELNQVIIKIIDRNTDTVIRELPPTEFQRVHLAIREALGHLIDEKV